MNIEKSSQEQVSHMAVNSLEEGGRGGIKRVLDSETQIDSCSMALNLSEVVFNILTNITTFSELAKCREISTSWQLIVDDKAWPFQCEQLQLQHKAGGVSRTDKLKAFIIKEVTIKEEFLPPFKNMFYCFYTKITLELLHLICIYKIKEIDNIKKALVFRNKLTFLHNLNSNDNVNTFIKPKEKYCIQDLIDLSSSEWCKKNESKFLKIETIFFDNFFTYLPMELCHLKNLTSLIFNNSKAKNFPSAIFQLTKLQHISLTNNRISNIPSEIGTLTNLENLSLENNQITSLPPEIGQLSKLKKLSLEGNNLNHLPIEFFKLVNLTEITFSSHAFPAILEEGIKTLLGKRVLYGKNQRVTRILTIEKWEDSSLDHIIYSDSYASG